MRTRAWYTGMDSDGKRAGSNGKMRRALASKGAIEFVEEDDEESGLLPTTTSPAHSNGFNNNNNNSHDSNSNNNNTVQRKSGGRARPRVPLWDDAWNIVTLLVLYTLQGIPMGLAASVPLILQTKGVTMKQQALFTFVAWPYR